MPYDASSSQNEGNKAMVSHVIGYRTFSDGTLRIIYEDGEGQYIVNDFNRRVYGWWLIPEEGAFPLPLPTELEAPDRQRARLSSRS
jgi:hypothetical protein